MGLVAAESSNVKDRTGRITGVESERYDWKNYLGESCFWKKKKTLEEPLGMKRKLQSWSSTWEEQDHIGWTGRGGRQEGEGGRKWNTRREGCVVLCCVVLCCVVLCCVSFYVLCVLCFLCGLCILCFVLCCVVFCCVVCSVVWSVVWSAECGVCFAAWCVVMCCVVVCLVVWRVVWCVWSGLTLQGRRGLHKMARELPKCVSQVPNFEKCDNKHRHSTWKIPEREKQVEFCAFTLWRPTLSWYLAPHIRGFKPPWRPSRDTLETTSTRTVAVTSDIARTSFQKLEIIFPKTFKL